MAKRGGPCGPTRGPLIKNAGRADLFNPLTRISPPRISQRPARTSSGAGRAGPLTRKKKMDESFSKATSNVIEMEECQ